MTTSFRTPVLRVLALALGPASAIGIARFAYGLLLPSMMSDMRWSYSQSGLINSINAVGYLAGALVSGACVRRFGAARVFAAGMIAVTASLMMTGTTASFGLLGCYRLVAGLGGAAVFVSGGTLAVSAAEGHPASRGRLLALFYAGPGFGILLTALLVTLADRLFGAADWQAGWVTLGMACLVASLIAIPTTKAPRTGVPRPDAEHGVRYRPTRHLRIMAAYTVFGAGSVGYMTFMVTRLGGLGTGTGGLALFWSLLGLGALSAPAVWSHVLQTCKGGSAFCLIAAANLGGALLPLLVPGPIAAFASAIVFGSTFFTIVAATTAFAARNVAAHNLPEAITAFTIAFGLGQTAGPLLGGFVSDLTGTIDAGLLTGAGLILLALVTASGQRDDRDQGSGS